jgi:hypothetical protein
MSCSSYQVHTALREDFNQGWIWIRSNDLLRRIEGSRKIVRIRKSERKNGVYCEAVWADDFYIREFKIIDPMTADCQIFMGKWYRHRLEVEKGQRVELAIDFPGRVQKIFWQFRACLQHPQVVVVLATALGIIAVGLGIIGFGLGLIGIQHLAPFGQGVGLGFVLVGAVVVFLGIAPLATRG